MPDKNPEPLLRSPLVRGALAEAERAVRRNIVESLQEVPLEHIIQWAVGAALRYIADDRKPPPVIKIEPAPRPRDGGGNVHESGPTALGGPAEVLHKQSKAMGYTGDVCQDCGNVAMVRNGTCLKCTVCGSTSGCS